MTLIAERELLARTLATLQSKLAQTDLQGERHNKPAACASRTCSAAFARAGVTVAS